MTLTSFSHSSFPLPLARKFSELCPQKQKVKAWLFFYFHPMLGIIYANAANWGVCTLLLWSSDFLPKNSSTCTTPSLRRDMSV